MRRAGLGAVLVLVLGCGGGHDHAPSTSDGPKDTATASPDATGPCEPAMCGVSCYEPESCGTCGDGVCADDEGPDGCAADCCDVSACDPASGEPVSGGAATCAGAPDGTLCSDQVAANGAETCRGGVCRREPLDCRCPAAGGLFPDPAPPEEEPEDPTPPADPAWAGVEPSDEAFDTDWALHRIDLSRAWARTRGAPDLMVAIIDSGCGADVADLAGQVVGQRDVVDLDDVAEDELGHGTAMASIVAGLDDGAGVVGVAPGVKLLCVRVSSGPYATPEAIAAGIDWAVEHGASVALVGMVSSGPSAALEAAVDAADAAGVVLVAPSGSDGRATVDRFPGALPAVLSVTASDRVDHPFTGADLSPRTPLAAPGESVAAAAPGGGWSAHHGSSVASALVAGAAALVRSAEPSLSPAQVRALLYATAAPIPIDGFDEFFDVRRLDVGAAVEAADPALTDVAVAKVAPGTQSVLPGSAVPIRVVVENRGVVDLGPTTVSAQATGGAMEVSTATVDALPIGATATVAFVLLPDVGSAEATVEVTVSAAGDSRSENDTRQSSVLVGESIVHLLRIPRGELLPPAPGSATRTVEVVVENAGNVAEPAGELRVGLISSESGAVEVLAVPALAVGERATVTTTVTPSETPDGRHAVRLFLRPARGQVDIARTAPGLQFVYEPGVPLAVPAYTQLITENLIADAPWRTQRDIIPVLIFYARTGFMTPVALIKGLGAEIKTIHWTDFRLRSVVVKNPPTPEFDLGENLYVDNTLVFDKPVSAGYTAYVVTDEWGNVRPNHKVAQWSATEAGTHSILWIPFSQLKHTQSGNMIDPEGRGAFLDVRFNYFLKVGNEWLRKDTRHMLGVQLTTSPLPRLNDEDHYVDAHFHSIAEWYTGVNPTGPAKAYGGPLHMLVAAAWSLGFIENASKDNITPPTMEDGRGKLITTDHNTFFDDEEAPGAGPTKTSEWADGGDASADTQSREMDLYRQILGDWVGEEVSLDPDPDGGERAKHALVYDASTHVNGDWGAYKNLGDNCTPSLDNLLRRMSCYLQDGAEGECPEQLKDWHPAKSETCIGGFTYAAHPFATGYKWSDTSLNQALSFDGEERYVFDFEDFVFRGYQFWNGRPTRTLIPKAATLKHRNPFVGATGVEGEPLPSWSPSCDDVYYPMVAEGFNRYLHDVAKGLLFEFDSDEEVAPRFFRKLYFVGGSDAHGDFNYTADLVAEALTDSDFITGMVGGNSISDSAFGRPRTYILGGTLEDYRRGRTIVTDGPLLEIEIDGQGRGSHTDDGAWLWSDDQSFQDRDGLIGGAGRYDGGRTALVPWIGEDTLGTPPEYGEVQSVIVRARCVNDPVFGGPKPADIELLMTWANEITILPLITPNAAVTPLSGAPMACNGQWHSFVVHFGGAADEPRKQPLAVIGHIRYDGAGACGTRYDGYTNPIWVAPVKATRPNLRVVERQATKNMGVRLVGDIVITAPISMRDFDKVDARLFQRDPEGGPLIPLSGGHGGSGRFKVEDGGWADHDGKAMTRLVLTLVNETITGEQRAASLAEERFVLAIARTPLAVEDDTLQNRKLRDYWNNPLGVLTFGVRASAELFRLYPETPPAVDLIKGTPFGAHFANFRVSTPDWWRRTCVELEGALEQAQCYCDLGGKPNLPVATQGGAPLAKVFVAVDPDLSAPQLTADKQCHRELVLAKAVNETGTYALRVKGWTTDVWPLCLKNYVWDDSPSGTSYSPQPGKPACPAGEAALLDFSGKITQ